MTKIRLFALAVAAAIAVQGCAVQAPDAARMAAEVTPSAWTRTSLPAGDIASYRDFWQRWNDPDLVALVERTLDANTDIQTAMANLRAARASLTSANAALWPTAALNGDGRRSKAGSAYSTSYSAEGSGAWTLSLGGSEFFTADAAQESALASSLTLEDTRAMTVAEVAQAYVNLRTAQAQLAVVKETLANYVETADTARWQFEAGMGTASEAEDALVQLSTAMARIPQLEGSIAEYRNAIARLASLPADKLPIAAERAIPEPPEGCAAAMPAQVLERRPDVRSALHSLQAAVYRLQSAKGNFFPSLSLSGNIGTTAATIGALGASGTGVAGLMAALSVPVLNWGSLIAAEETAAAELDQARAQYLAVLLSALEQTDNALSGIANAERRALNLTRAVSHARIAEQLARYEYETGIGDYAMLLTTQRSLLSTLESELSNRADRANNYIMLYRAVGGGWAVQAAAAEQMEKNAQSNRSTDVGLEGREGK